MAGADTQRLTRIKLRELERQRDRLNDHYTAVEGRARAADAPLERLRALHEGLRAATFAQSPLHPDIANLDALFFEARVGTAPPGLVDSWVRRLQHELAQGRLRAEFAYVFGRLLDEWANPGTGEPAAGGTPPPPGEEPWAVMSDETPASVDLALLADLFRRNEAVFAGARQAVRSFGEREALAPVSDDEVRALLGALGRDIYRQPSLRRQAVATLSGNTQVHEYAGVLTILLNNLAEWDWPAEGLELRPLWTRNKWRPYLDEDLLTILFLQLIGLRWGIKLKGLISPLLREGRGGLFAIDPRLPAHVAAIERLRLERVADLFMPQAPNSLDEWVSSRGGYGEGGYGGPGGGGTREEPDALESLLAALVGEARFHRDAHPGAALVVVQTDLRDFYPRIPHPVLLALLEHLGFPPAWQDFFRRYLQVRLRDGEGTRTVRRGLLLDHLVGAVFGELLLELLDVHVYQAAGVRLFRVIDDIYFLADTPKRAVEAWKAVQGFCRACGLDTNPDKSGSVCLYGDADLKGLPQGLPRWGLLRLHPDAVWRLDEPACESLEERIRQDAESAPAVLGLVACLNDYLSYLLRHLGVRVDLGESHLDEVGRRLARLYQGLFGDGHGVAEEIRRRVGERFLDARMRERGLPEALLYWPITAGGLGLTQPLIHLAALQKARAGLAEPAPPLSRFGEEFPYAYAWESYYRSVARLLRPAKPAETPSMERLLSDFIARGSKVSGRQQTGLGSYWQWVVYTYGPQLLESLGTFRFLLTELVPLQLIFQSRIEGQSLGGETAGGDAGGQGTSTGVGPPEEIPF
jgi:hypothetical protein